MMLLKKLSIYFWSHIWFNCLMDDSHFSYITRSVKKTLIQTHKHFKTYTDVFSLLVYWIWTIITITFCLGTWNQ